MNQKSDWLILAALYGAAVWIDWPGIDGLGIDGLGTDSSGNEATLSVLLYVLVGLIACWLPSRAFHAWVLIAGITCLLPIIVSPTTWLNRMTGSVCLIALVAARRHIVSNCSSQELFDGDTLFVQTQPDSDRDAVSRDGTAEGEETEFIAIPLEEARADHQTRIHKTHHRRHRESGQFALDARVTRAYVEPALERLYSSGCFDESQMRMIAGEMRSLEEHGLVADFVSCLPGGTQVGRFIIDEPLGRGGEGNVYRGHDDSGQPAAIKILHNMRVSDRFRREMHLVRQLAHPNIVTAYEVGEFRGLPFITMELLAGPDLSVRVRESGPINWQPATHYILQAARALAHAHRRNLIHRDVKPGNMILNSDSSIKLVDFGLAAEGVTSANASDSVFRYRTEDGHLAGTLPFMAPEQARSLANANVRSDIYGLGATWFYLLTGRERLRGTTFAQQFENLLVLRGFNELNNDCMPESLRKIYRRMVQYDARQRFESCEELCHEIESALKDSGRIVIPDEIHVLVIEDSRTDMLFTIEMLRRSNSTLNVHQARSLASGIESCRRDDIGLVLLDLSLPDSHGVETVRRFREIVPDIPLVVLTGMTEDEVGAACLEAGAESFVSKNGLTAHRMERTIFVTMSRYDQARRVRAIKAQGFTSEVPG